MHKNLTEEEKTLLARMINYYQRAAEREIEELRAPGGNPAFISREDEDIRILRSLRNKLLGTE
jgi:hypothetical protein